MDPEFEAAVVNISRLLPRLIEELEKYNNHQALRERCYPTNRRYDPKAVLEIVREASPLVIGSPSQRTVSTTGALLGTYRRKTGLGISLRQFNNILHRLEGEGLVEGQIINEGRYGRSTVWKLAGGGN